MEESQITGQNCFFGIAIHTFALPGNSMEFEIGNLLNLNIILISAKKGFFSESVFSVRLFFLKSSHSVSFSNNSVIFLGFSANLKENRAD